MPAVSGNVTAPVDASGWAAIGQDIFVQSAGYFRVAGIPDATDLTLTNLGYTGNVAPGTGIAAGQAVSPAGIKGTDGAAGSATLNDLSPTTTKGDIIVDNGATSPVASDVRLGVGTNGKALVADSSQPTGLNYATITPNTAATDGDIPVFNGTTGTPMALKDSKLLITSDGAIQSTPSGGNARGSKAVDLQVDRALATQVASGANSVITGGKNGTASGANSAVCAGNTNAASGISSGVACGETNAASANGAFVGGGVGNTASGTDAAIAGGFSNVASNFAAAVCAGGPNTASGNSAFVGAGSQNTASGVCATVGAGFANVASGDNSCVPGGFRGVANLFAELSHAGFLFASPGDAQTNELIWGIATTDATANVEMFLDGSLSTQRAIVGLNNTWAFHIHLIGRSSAGVCAMWEAKGAIQDIAATVSLVAGPIVPVVVADGTGGTWGLAANFAVTADNTNKSLKLAVTGAVATNIRWVAHARIVQVHF